MKTTMALSLLLLIGLTACAGSGIRQANSAERRDVVLDGQTIAVVPEPTHWVSWWEPKAVIDRIPPLPYLKPLQVKAIEQVSGCKVTGAEYLEGALWAATLQAVVDCSEKKS